MSHQIKRRLFFFSLKKRKTPFMSVEFAIEDWIGIAEPMVDWLLEISCHSFFQNLCDYFKQDLVL